MRRRPALLLLALALTLAATCVGAHAHGARDGSVRAVLPASLPSELAGMRVEVHRTVGPQLVLENPTTHVVEVLDDDGVAFLRIGPGGTAGNVASAAWFQTYGPGMPVPAAARDASSEARWARARREPSYGWFDPRLDAGSVVVPHAVRDGGRTADVGRWQIPLRVDGADVVLAGTFRYEPPRDGVYRARLRTPAEIAPGVRVRLLPGGEPGLLVKNTSRLPLTVLDDAGEPFLRIGRKGVAVNLRSDAWARSGRHADVPAGFGPADLGNPHWLRITRAPAYGWIDPRIASTRDGGAPEHAWRVPVLLGATPLQLEGTTAWGDRHDLVVAR